MTEQIFRELHVSRRRSLTMLPVALTIFTLYFGVVWLEGLHLSEVGFLPGALVGALAYWVILEFMTIVRASRKLRAIASTPPSP